MKKRILSIVCVISILLVSLSACGAPKTADSLYDKINKTMNKLESVESDLTMEIGFYSNGSYVNAEAKGKNILKPTKDDFYYYNKTTTTVGATSTSKGVVTDSIIAYNDGNLFIANLGKLFDQKLYSPLGVKEAQEYFNENSMDMTVLDKASQKSFIKNEDESYVITFNGYSQDSIEYILESFGFDDFSFDNKLEDMKVTIKATSEYLVDDMTVDFVFSEQPKFPRESKFFIKVDYVKYENVEKITSDISTDSFKKVDDVRFLDKIEELIKER